MNKMWPFKKDRTWDFEGRCMHPDHMDQDGCAKALDLRLVVETNQRIALSVEACSEHPDEGLILWPQRSDIIREAGWNLRKGVVQKLQKDWKDKGKVYWNDRGCVVISDDGYVSEFKIETGMTIHSGFIK